MDVVRERRRQRRRDAQLLRNLPLAHGLARRYAGLYGSEDELATIARAGLAHAVEQFDPDAGQPFAAFAEQAIVAELEEHVRDTKAYLEARRRTIQRGQAAVAQGHSVAEALARQSHVHELAAALGCGVADVVAGLLEAVRRDPGLLAERPAGARPDDHGARPDHRAAG